MSAYGRSIVMLQYLKVVFSQIESFWGEVESGHQDIYTSTNTDIVCLYLFPQTDPQTAKLVFAEENILNPL